AHERKKLAFRYVERSTCKRVHGRRALAVRFRDVLEVDHSSSSLVTKRFGRTEPGGRTAGHPSGKRRQHGSRDAGAHDEADGEPVEYGDADHAAHDDVEIEIAEDRPGGRGEC